MLPHEDEINKVLRPTTRLTFAIGARVGVHLFRNVLFQRESRHFEGSDVGKLQEVAASNDLGFFKQKLGYSEIDKHFVEESSCELGPRSVTNSSSGLFAELARSLYRDLEEIVDVDSLSDDQFLLGGGETFAVHEIDVFSSAGNFPQPEVESEGSFEHPCSW